MEKGEKKKEERKKETKDDNEIDEWTTKNLEIRKVRTN